MRGDGASTAHHRSLEAKWLHGDRSLIHRHAGQNGRSRTRRDVCDTSFVTPPQPRQPDWDFSTSIHAAQSGSHSHPVCVIFTQNDTRRIGLEINGSETQRWGNGESHGALTARPSSCLRNRPDKAPRPATYAVAHSTGILKIPQLHSRSVRFDFQNAVQCSREFASDYGLLYLSVQ